MKDSKTFSTFAYVSFNKTNRCCQHLNQFLLTVFG